MAGWWQRLGRRRQLAELSPAEGYWRWAPDYGREPNAFQQLESAAFENLLPDLAGARVLDLGCGKGRLCRVALERGAFSAVAADFSLAMLAAGDTVATARLLANASRPLPFRPESFDAVFCALVLGHVEDSEAALASMVRVLRPGGHLLLSDFHPDATRRGWQRTFVDPESGATRAIEQHLHPLPDTIAALERLGLVIEALEEPAWQGSPVAFVMRALTPPGPSLPPPHTSSRERGEGR